MDGTEKKTASEFIKELYRPKGYAERLIAWEEAIRKDGEKYIPGCFEFLADDLKECAAQIERAYWRWRTHSNFRAFPAQKRHFAA